MKNNLKTKISFVILWIFLIVSFTSLAVFVVLEANGYRLNRGNLTLEPTGLISLDGQPKDVSVLVNNKIVSKSLPFKLSKILPGQYEITVTKENYTTWSKLTNIVGGQAFDDSKIYLFFTSPVIKESTKNISIDQLRKDAQNQSSLVKIIGNEIWYQDALLTRFSESPTGAILADSRQHIIFQLGQELRVIELDGSNNTKLFDFSNSEPKVFALYNDKIIFPDQDKIYEAEIR